MTMMKPGGLKAAASVAALLVLVLVVCAAAPAAANRPLMMGSNNWINSEIARVSRSLQQYQADTCPTGYKPAFAGRTTVPPTPAVQWSQLDDLKWAVPANRPSTTAVSTAIASPDFWTVNCNSFGRVDNGRTGCVKKDAPSPEDLRGATHIRYNCSENALWILTYAFSDIPYNTDTSGMFAQVCSPADATTCRNSAGAKTFVAYDGTAAGGSCAGSTQPCDTTCNAATQFCRWCCVDMWPVLDNNVWVGWMAQVRFNNLKNASYTQFMTHWDSAGENGGTVSSVTDDDPQGLCLDCSVTSGDREPEPPIEEGCPPGPILEVSGPSPSPSVCSTATSVVYVFTVTSTLDTAPITYTQITGCSIVPDAGSIAEGVVTYSVSVTCPISVTPVTLVATQAFDPTGAECIESVEGRASATIITQPQVTAVGPSTPQAVCSDATSKTFLYTLTSTESAPISVTGVSPAYCSANVTAGSQIASGDSVLFTCSNNPGSWTGFNLGFTATALTSLAGCFGSETVSLPVTVNTKPIVTVAAAGTNAANVCSNQTSVTLDYTVTTDPNTQSAYVLVSGTTGTCTSVQNATTVSSGSTITVTCTKPDSGGWPSGGFGVSVSAVAGLAADCLSDDTETSSIADVPLPKIVVTPPAADQAVCSNQTSVSFSVKVENLGGSTANMAVTVASNDTTGGLGTCSVAPNTNVPNNTDVTVTCTAPTPGGFTPGTYRVTVTASAGAGTCANVGSGDTTVVISPKPAMSLTLVGGPTNNQICDSAESFSYEYTVSSGRYNVPASVSVSSDKCTVTPTANVANNTRVNVTCYKSQGTPSGAWPTGSLALSITASASTATCGDSTTLQAPVTINAAPTVTITQPSAVTTCARGAVSLSVTATTTRANTNTMTVTATPSQGSGVTCTATTRSGASGGSANYTTSCSHTSGTLPASFTVSFTATDGAAGCTNSDTKSLAVTSVCCATGSSYAWGSVSGACTAACFNGVPALCSNSNWGWRNKLSGPSTRTYNNIVGAGAGCKNTQNVVGSITVKCEDRSGNAIVTLSNLQQPTVPPNSAHLLDRHYYVGCTTVTTPTCTPPRFGAAATDSCNSTRKRCGGDATAVLGVPITVRGCCCSKVYWIYHQSSKNGVSFAINRTSSNTCPAV